MTEESENIKKWLVDRRGLLNLKGIEESAYIPVSTLKNFLRGERGLPSAHEVNLVRFLATLGYEPVQTSKQKQS
jgi:1,2-phenylacetyl-CoA epoxidase catalytic subunit